MVKVAPRNRESDESKPLDYFSLSAKLGPMLLEGHKDKDGKPRVNLDKDSFQRIINWLDLNAQYHGLFSHNYREYRKVSKSGEKALRDHVRQLFGAEMADQPLSALVNHAMETESRILKAPLAEKAGGWGQIAKGWASTSDAGYRKTLELIRGVFEAMQRQDVCGTCGSFKHGGRCSCGCCWVAGARTEYVKKYASRETDKGTKVTMKAGSR
jgi:hypothetical protein